MFFHIPTQLCGNLTEAAAELEFGGSFFMDSDSWSVFDQDGKLTGWFFFSEGTNYTEIEICPVAPEKASELISIFQNLRDLLSESVGSDQCKSGKCTA